MVQGRYRGILIPPSSIRPTTSRQIGLSDHRRSCLGLVSRSWLCMFAVCRPQCVQIPRHHQHRQASPSHCGNPKTIHRRQSTLRCKATSADWTALAWLASQTDELIPAGRRFQREKPCHHRCAVCTSGRVLRSHLPGVVRRLVFVACHRPALLVCVSGTCCQLLGLVAWIQVGAMVRGLAATPVVRFGPAETSACSGRRTGSRFFHITRYHFCFLLLLLLVGY
ncbi:hypothetical protein VTI74DRAFT_545 [Chaetomium olivicolor]